MTSSLEELKEVAKDRLPKHIGLIIDGNRRWAKERNLEVNFGHMVGYENLKKRLFDFFDAGIQYLSLYILSLENALVLIVISKILNLSKNSKEALFINLICTKI